MNVRELNEAFKDMDQAGEVRLSVIAQVDVAGAEWRTGGRPLKTVEQFDYPTGSIDFLAE